MQQGKENCFFYSAIADKWPTFLDKDFAERSTVKISRINLLSVFWNPYTVDIIKASKFEIKKSMNNVYYVVLAYMWQTGASKIPPPPAQF